MRILFIATGYLPYLFSENLVNAKLVFAMQEAGWSVDVISRKDDGPAYDANWQEPWIPLKAHTYEISYSNNKLYKVLDFISSLITTKWPFVGARWIKHAYEQACDLIEKNEYDAVITRSPTDISHIVGYKLQKKYGIRWIANWNDPATTIWPEPYTHHLPKYTEKIYKHFEKRTLQSADVTSFPSETLKQHFIKHYPFLKEKDTIVIPHIGLSKTIYPKCSHNRSNILRICHSGNMSKERNPELLFKAIRESIDNGQDKILLDVMGHTNLYVQELITKYRLENHVHLIGSYPYLESIKKLQEYDILLLLEAQMEKGIFFASKIVDYVQTGRPILALSPKVGFASSFIKEHNCGLAANNKDYKAIKSALAEIYNCWKQGNLSEQFKNTSAIQSFSPEKVVDSYLQLLK